MPTPDYALSALHPKARSTTMRIARDWSQRMDYSRRIVFYDPQGTVARLKMSESNVKGHVSYLRELGALVRIEHGSKRNLRLPCRKHIATATIYAAPIPTVHDLVRGIDFAARATKRLPLASRRPAVNHGCGGKGCPEASQEGGVLRPLRRGVGASAPARTSGDEGAGMT
ncbi:hypothetical protein GCM10009863_64000 [Streptomyces axinellae]|uniref:ArsR family transcriptional regulator n=1 Tax=Streptomyces axinellae TaxID=552788 RepID=A0ABP6DB40_9ACTN